MVTSAVTDVAEQRQRSIGGSSAADAPAIIERCLVPLLIVVVPLLVFLPAIANGFVWDDHFNFVSNREYRGLGWPQIMWMLTSAHLSHWIPVTWLTLGLDYVVWGMSPAGYHLSNILLHSANAWVFYLVARRLLRAAAPTTPHAVLVTGAAGAALFFAVHPLRAESVAWITERRDLVSGLLFLLAALAYLCARDPGKSPSRWLAMSVVCFQFGVLAKSIVVTLPAVLLILDVYPLRRLEPSVLRWTKPTNRRVLAEKLPYVPMIILGSLVAISTFGRDGALTSLDTLPLADRAIIMLHGASFYVWKTLVPFGLSPLYELPLTISAWDPRFAMAALATLGITVLLGVLGRCWPGGLAAWLVYLCILAPVSGGMHNGRHLAADRNTYLACLPWALVFGGMAAAAVRAKLAGFISRPAFRLSSVALGAWLVALAALATHQTTIWRDEESLWRHALAADPGCFTCHNNLGTTLMANGMTTAAIDHFQRAVALRPLMPVPHGALVLAHLAAGAPERAEAELRLLRVLDPGLARDLSPVLVPDW